MFRVGLRGYSCAVVAMVLMICLSMVTITGSTNETTASASTEAVVEDYVTVGWTGSVVNWNPLVAAFDEDVVACHMIYSSLFMYDENLHEAVPDLAMGYEQTIDANGTMTTVVNISANAYFRSLSDPEDTSHPLTADDVVFTFLLILNNPGMSTWFPRLTGVFHAVALDDYRVSIVTDSARATLIDDLAGVPIVPEYIYSTLTKPFAGMNPEDLLGSGPFLFQSDLEGAWCAFRKAPNYHGETDYGDARTVKVPGVRYITYSSIADVTLSINAGDIDAGVVTGNVDIFIDLLGNGASVDVVRQVVSEPGICDIAINAIPLSFRTERYGDGNLHLLDPVVRQAILMTLNKNYIVDAMTCGIAITGSSVIEPGYWHNDIENLPFDPAAARELLQSNGYADIDGDYLLEAGPDAYVVREGLLPLGSELSGIRCQAPNSDQTYGFVAMAWQGWAADAGIGLQSEIVSETVMVNVAWYQADYDIWVWHWDWDPEPLSDLSVWLTSEIGPAGDNCQMPMGPWWYDSTNFTEAPAEWGLTGPYSAFDQNHSLAARTFDVEERRDIVYKLQQWIFDSYTESPPFYDFGLYGYTTERFMGWGSWTSYPGRAIMAGLPWLWFDLVPSYSNAPPVIDSGLEMSYTVDVGEEVTFQVQVHDDDGDELMLNWSFGDEEGAGVVLISNTTLPTTVSQTHVYSHPASGLVVSVTVSDGYPGHEIYVTSVVDVLSNSQGNRSVGYVWHGMFEQPFGEWMDKRGNIEIVSNEYPYIYAEYEPTGTKVYKSNMRLNVISGELPEVNMRSNPEFLPLFGDVRGGFACVDLYMQFITLDEAEEIGPLAVSWYDGWFIRLSGVTAMDLTGAMAVMGISESSLDDFPTWWADHGDAFELQYKNWMVSESERLGIFSTSEWPLQFVKFDLGAYMIDDMVYLTYDTVSWSMEALMTKWLREAFMPTEWMFEDFKLHAEISEESADIDVDTAVVGAVFAWQDADTGQPSWVWRGMLQDHILSTTVDPYSDFDAYAPLDYLDMYTGSPTYASMIPFDYAPGAFSLSYGETMYVEWPQGPQTFLANDGIGGVMTFEQEIASPYSEPSQYDLPSFVTISDSSRTMTFQGPLDVYQWSQEQTSHWYLESEWDRLGVLPYGMPWIEFRPSTVVVDEKPVASLVVSNDNPSAGEIILFDASGSYDIDGYIESYRFDFGDGVSASTDQPTVMHSYDSEGMYIAELTVYDNNGSTGTAEVAINVSAHSSSPVAIIGSVPPLSFVGEAIVFDASPSYDPDGEIVRYDWDFGDGTTMEGMVVNHTYQNDGMYLVSLTVMDNSMMVGEAWANITISSVPIASFLYSPLAPDEDDPVTFYAYGSYDSAGIVEYAWSFGDGMNDTGWEVVHVYDQPGVYVVTLTVTNVYGVQSSLSEELEVGRGNSGIRGTVVSENLRPIKNAVVELSIRGVTVASTMTDDRGEFTIKDLNPGVYDLTISKRGYVTVTMTVTVGDGILDIGSVVLANGKITVASVVSTEYALWLAEVVALIGVALLAGFIVRSRKATGR